MHNPNLNNTTCGNIATLGLRLLRMLLGHMQLHMTTACELREIKFVGQVFR